MSCCSQIRMVGVTLGSKKILENVNLHFHCGQMTAIIGPNGAGKSTLLKAIIGEVPYSGTIVFQKHGDDRSGKPSIGYVPQKTAVEPTNPMSVRDVFMSAVSRWPVFLFNDKNVDSQALHALSHMDATHLYKKRIGALSGGELQRVLVALALTPMPELLLLDEPVSGIDQAGMALFYRMVSEIRRAHDLSIVMVSHDIALSVQYADRLVLLQETVVAEGVPSNVLAHPKTRELMGFIEPGDLHNQNATDHHGKSEDSHD